MTYASGHEWTGLPAPGEGNRTVVTINATGSIFIAAPPEDVFAWLEAFDQYEEFVLGVHKVEPLPDGAMRWTAETGEAEQDRTWDAEITERVPGRRLAWASRTGPTRRETVDISPENNGTTVRWTVETGDADVADEGEDRARVLSERLRGDLDRLRDLLEGRRGTGPRANEDRTPSATIASGPRPAIDREGNLTAPAPPTVPTAGGNRLRQMDRPEVEPDWAAEPGDPVDPDETQPGPTQDEPATG